MSDRRPATERLVEALLAAGLDRMDPMVRRAEDGEYDDFKSRRFRDYASDTGCGRPSPCEAAFSSADES